MTKLYRLALVLSIAGCAREKPSSAPPVPAAEAGDPSAATYAPQLGVNLGSATKLPSGLYYTDLVVGTGPVVVPNQRVAVHYTGWLPDGTRFDGNEGGEPFSFRLGAHEVIDGWDQGVAGMRVGGKRQIVIPPALGYGASGSGPIPPNAVLVFTVQVDSAWTRP